MPRRGWVLERGPESTHPPPARPPARPLPSLAVTRMSAPAYKALRRSAQLRALSARCGHAEGGRSGAGAEAAGADAAEDYDLRRLHEFSAELYARAPRESFGAGEAAAGSEFGQARGKRAAPDSRRQGAGDRGVGAVVVMRIIRLDDGPRAGLPPSALGAPPRRRR
jgi:hypothetical protein